MHSYSKLSLIRRKLELSDLIIALLTTCLLIEETSDYEISVGANSDCFRIAH